MDSQYPWSKCSDIVLHSGLTCKLNRRIRYVWSLPCVNFLVTICVDTMWFNSSFHFFYRIQQGRMNWQTVTLLTLVFVITIERASGSTHILHSKPDSKETIPELSLRSQFGHFSDNDNSNALAKLLHDNEERRRQENYDILLSTLNMLAKRHSSEKSIWKEFGNGSFDNHLESSKAEKRTRQLSISGALSSLADMLEAERRKQWVEHLRNLGKRSLSKRSLRDSARFFWSIIEVII